ncbi:M14 family metallopeptidase [Dyadobacter sp. CY312]|uniref:M14 family metallopeptidase n=1 Tax=Dyadobacter sp. CY312 TaxID=2907303 RepID=UPI001F440B61|nr:M14 family metallopeptidase [Dyadobacter sp. CY312]MCE7042504.1 M14 family metallopeptidase [Dyadobacter sp. CY312]
MKLIQVMLTALAISGAGSESLAQFKGQGPIQGVPTESRPVEKQWKGIFPFEKEQVFFSNDFTGARLNKANEIGKRTYDLRIEPENTPVNGSPWYAFKVWANQDGPVRFSFSYPDKVKHRYEPKISKDGTHWEQLTFKEENGIRLYEVNPGKDTIWVAAQELTTSAHVDQWIKNLEKKQGVKSFSIGKSTLGRPIQAFRFGNDQSKNYLVILGRQHPPEVTGHKALVAFTEALLSENAATKSLRDQFQVIVLPLLNPDGVDEGFWRHNAGGIDLNRDWSAFNQPETKAVRDFLKKEITGDKKLLASIDFHSTFDDIYYVVEPARKGNVPDLVPNWLSSLKERIPGYLPNIKPLYSEPPTYTSFSYLFETYGAESLVYEIGDATDPEFIRTKGRVSAEELARLLNEFVGSK